MHRNTFQQSRLSSDQSQAWPSPGSSRDLTLTQYMLSPSPLKHCRGPTVSYRGVAIQVCFKTSSKKGSGACKSFLKFILDPTPHKWETPLQKRKCSVDLLNEAVLNAKAASTERRRRRCGWASICEEEAWELVHTTLPSLSTSFLRDRQGNRRGHLTAWHL